MTDPATLMQRIDDDCEALDNGAKALDALVDSAARVELEYLEALDKALIEVEDHYANLEQKLPSEQQRVARAHQKMDRTKREAYLESKRTIELIEKWGRMREKALSGRQSELSFLKAEGQAPATQSGWSGRQTT
jgi:hypothetical protein